ncbi:MAG: SDR family oxidoreductase [Paracoccaceae bacterium]|nr:SDR family oxidoreductase [Paracoccaceae bacterium]
MTKRLLILGCGYSAQFISKKLISKGWRVFGTTRSKDNFRKFQDLKIEPIFWGDMSTLTNVLAHECSILSTIAPSGLVDQGLNKIIPLLKHDRARVKWLGYFSSTGVYGDRMGGWVSEESEVDTIIEQGIARVEAEKNWSKLACEHNLPLFIFRVAGIYGPGRNVFERIKSGTIQKITKQNQYFSRIHVDDLAGAVCMSLQKPKLAGIYNICDDLPASSADVIDEATKILRLPSLPEVSFNDSNLSRMATSFYLESKRVSNKKLNHLLGYSLKYPTYISGLRSLII